MGDLYRDGWFRVICCLLGLGAVVLYAQFLGAIGLYCSKLFGVPTGTPSGHQSWCECPLCDDHGHECPCVDCNHPGIEGD